jgi:dTDP-4-dehydrorhamnose reductase
MDEVVVFGGSGMLGSMVVDYLARDNQLKIAATVRTQDLAYRFAGRVSEVEWRIVDVADVNCERLKYAIGNANWIINAIGMTKPYTHDDNPVEIERAVRINALLPYELGRIAAQNGARLLQIATDCVFDGMKGFYTENDPHNALDVYGKTKSLGEALLPEVNCLRSSIIGPEPKVYAFLLEWFRRQPQNARVNGFTNHQWNGVSTLHFAKICHGVISKNISLPHLQHLVPDGTISKADMLSCFVRDYHREDITINPTEAKTVIDRTLATDNLELNNQLWLASGYSQPPSIPLMVKEMAHFDYRFEGV